MGRVYSISRIMPFILMVWFIPLLLFTLLNPAVIVQGEPGEADNGDGTSTATWSFDEPLSYSVNNITIGDGEAHLTCNDTLFWLQSASEDFEAGKCEGRTYITGENLALNLSINEDFITNGRFNTSNSWDFVGDSNDAIISRWDYEEKNARLWHNTLYYTSIRFDSMDDVVATKWVEDSKTQFDEGEFIQNLIPPLAEGKGNMNISLTLSMPTNEYGVERNDPGQWDWSSITAVTMQIYIESDAEGQVHIQMSKKADDFTTFWESPDQILLNGWKTYKFDMTGYDGSGQIADPNTLGSVDMIRIHFTNISDPLPRNVYIDDIHLVPLPGPSVVFDSTGWVNQTFTKDFATKNVPGQVDLRFDYIVEAADNILDANLGVLIDDNLVWQEPIMIPTPGPGIWKTMAVDVSLLMSEARDYNISLEVLMRIDTAIEGQCSVRYDNVSITAQRDPNGTFESSVFDAGDNMDWKGLQWSGSEPGNTTLAIELRTGDSYFNVKTESPDASWSDWVEHLNNSAIQDDHSRFIQFRVLLNTMNTPVTPVLDDLNITYSILATEGAVETEDFMPSKVASWGVFNSASYEPPNTNITYWYSIDSGNNWDQIYPGNDLNSIATPKIRFRMDLSTSDTPTTPVLYEVNLAYRYDNIPPLVVVNTLDYGPYLSDPQEIIDVDFYKGGDDNVTLDFAQYKVSATGTWRDIFTQDNDSYTANWTVLWSDLEEGWNYVYIRCFDIVGNVNDSEYVRIYSGNMPPDAPNLIEPYYSEVVVSNPPTFSWTVPSDANGDSNLLYLIQWCHLIDFSEGVETEFTTESFFIPESRLQENITYYWRVRAYDGTDWGNFSMAYTFTINTTYYHPRIIAPVPNQVKVEDFGFWVLELHDCAEDIDSLPSQLEWYITGEDTSLYQLYSVNATTLSFITNMNKFGSDEVTLWVVDGDGNADYQVLWINITPVNDVPSIESIAPLVVHYDAPYRYNFYNYVKDIETPKESLILETYDQVHTDVDGLWVTFNYPMELLGETMYVGVSVIDEQGAFSTTVVSITVSDDWTPELSKELPDVTLYEGDTIVCVFDLDDYFIDPDEDSLYYAVGHSNMVITINNNHTVDITSPQNWSGSETVTFIAIDPSDARAEDIVTITVFPVNDPPTIAHVPNLVVHYDELYSFNLEPYISDPDNDVSELILSTTTENITFEGSIMNVMFPKSLEGQVVPVVIMVSDGKGSEYDSIGILVSDDHPPKSKVGSLPSVWFYEDTTFTPLWSLHDLFIDEDSEDTLTYTTVTDEVSVSINQTSGRITLRPNANWSGIVTLTIRAIDSHNAIGESDIMITVIPVNDPPVIEPIPEQEYPIGSDWTIDLKDYISDIDNDEDGFTDLTITVDNLHPGSVSLIGSVLIFSYPEGISFDNVTITVNDGENEVSSSFSVKLIEPHESTLMDNLDWKSLMALLLLSVCLIVGGVIKFRAKDDLVVEEAFLVNKNGTLVKHATRRFRPHVDSDILASMLTAVQLFITDSFNYSEHTELKELEFGEYRITIEKGKYAYLALFYSGELNDPARAHIKNWMEVFEEKYGATLHDWNGDVTVFDGLDEMTKGLFENNSRRLWLRKPRIIVPEMPSEGVDMSFKGDLNRAKEPMLTHNTEPRSYEGERIKGMPPLLQSWAFDEDEE